MSNEQLLTAYTLPLTIIRLLPLFVFVFEGTKIFRAFRTGGKY
jgi:hypothetical protein